jgi:DNA-binding transcriptional MocR family regulator
MYEKHIKKVRKSYEDKLRKSDKIFKTLNKDGFSYHVPEHGIFIWLQLPQYIEAAELEKKFEQHGILAQVANEFFPEKCFNGEDINNNCIRFCISGVSEEHMGALATVINEINNFKTLISFNVCTEPIIE